ncbi:bifunctional diguanylate cyclase/phosphodiesterase [Microvirga lotononidis]|uniref:PAS domain S-box/diguanylate cyclase (GGDEF) domain-containing protein n=1 Tax=Microvirga lotononidis TaxID=864069 RepID=I4YYV5_9HYPH|nr:GGDEF domain-containing phosphodiesterase [Microvirga lotononidis]EIM29147.1 PAS domain S-box/diguanylate cyclase (GGDEF) domain-containing protein [Microvirga lotononidis]WQO28989.1 EAL domain-containing protein [Microvirga lotononidis]
MTKRNQPATYDSLYHYAFTLSRQIPWLADANGNVVEVGPGWSEWIGQPPEALVGNGWVRLVHPDDLPRLVEARRESLADGTPYQCEYRIRMADGTYRWCRSSSAARRDETGAVAFWYGTTEDIHERKEAELVLQGHAHVLEMVAAGQPIGEILSALCHLAETQLPGTRCSVLLYDAETGSLRHGAAPNLPSSYNAAIDGLKVGPDRGSCGTAAYSRTSIIVADIATDPLWAEWRGIALSYGLRACWSKPVFSRSGDVLGTFGFYYGEPRAPTCDEMERMEAVLHLAALVLERQRSDVALRESEEHHRHSVELNPQISWTADPQGNLLDISSRWHDLTGMDLREALGSGWSRALHPDDASTSLRRWSQAVAAGERLDMDYRLRMADGTYRWVRSRAAPRRGGDGTIIRWYGAVEDIHDRKLTEETLRWAAHHDDLTGLANRRLFRERLQQALDAPSGRPRITGLLVMDLDHLKQINDRFGHDAGDDLLKEFAQRLRQAARPGDTVARLGGDEFAVLLPDIAGDRDVAAMADTILARMQEPLKRNGKLLDCRTSIGGTISSGFAMSPEELQKQADLALYRSKTSGRGSFKMFVATMREESQRTNSALELAARAVASDWIVPFYQPKVTLATGAIGGFEALLRWHHPRNGIQSPERIAPAFNDTELGTAIGERMRSCILKDIRAWLDAGLPFGRIAVNASAAEFRRDNYAERVLEDLRWMNVPAHCLEVEVTESVFLGSGAEYVERALRTLSTEGVTIALDDFGTGYASLSHLKRYPVDAIKIDRTFVGGLETDADDAAIVRALLNLGRNLGIEVVAEGVENAFQATLLQRMSCDLVQGYHFGRPMPAGDVPTFVTSWTGV